MAIINQSSYDYTSQRYESSKKPSKTIPDQSLTVRQVIERYAKGTLAPIAKEPVYHGDKTFYPDLKTLDLVQIKELRDKATARVADLEKSLQTQKQTRKQNADKKAFDAAVAAKVAEEQKRTNPS